MHEIEGVFDKEVVFCGGYASKRGGYSLELGGEKCCWVKGVFQSNGNMWL